MKSKTIFYFILVFCAWVVCCSKSEAAPASNDQLSARHRVHISLEEVPKGFSTNKIAQIRLLVTNNDSAVWNRDAFFVSYHWYNQNRETVVWDGLRSPLPVSLAPGKTAEVTASVRCPHSAGSYFLAFDVVHEGVEWLQSSRASRIKVEVAWKKRAYSVTIKQLTPVGSMYSGERLRVKLEITNTGTKPLSGREGESVSYHWLSSDHKIFHWEGERRPIYPDLLPGETRVIRAMVYAPARSGTYVLAWDVVREGKEWVVPKNEWELSRPIKILKQHFLNRYLRIGLLILTIFVGLIVLWRSYVKGKSVAPIASGILVAIAIATIPGKLINYKPDTNGMWADEATHIMSAMSIAYDFDIRYTPKDISRFRRLTLWDRPDGLFLNRTKDGEYYFSKPIIYAILSAGFFRLFGTRGPLVLNFLLLASIAAVLFYTNLRRERNPFVSAMIALAFVFSSAYIYVFPVQPDLTIAALLFFAVFSWSLALPTGEYFAFPWNFSNKQRNIFLALSAILFGAAVYEKLPFGIVLIVFAAYTTYSYGWRKALPLLIGATVVFFILTSIHLFTIGQWSPYRGERFYFLHSFPFLDNSPNPTLTNTGKYFDVGKLIGNMSFVVGNLPTFLKDYLIGRYTGLLPYFGAGVLYIGLCLFSIRRFKLNAVLAVCGFCYIAFCVLLEPNNYYGGSQSFGNRYFLQIFPTLMLARSKHFRGRAMILMTAVGLMAFPLGNALIAPGRAMRSPWMYVDENPYLRVLPQEVSQALTISEGEPFCDFHPRKRFIIIRTDALTAFTNNCTTYQASDGARFMIRIQGDDYTGQLKVLRRNGNGTFKIFRIVRDWKRISDPLGNKLGYSYQTVSIPGTEGSHNVFELRFEFSKVSP